MRSTKLVSSPKKSHPQCNIDDVPSFISSDSPTHIIPQTPSPSSPVNISKQDSLIAGLQTKSGITLRKMMSITGWQAHSVRGTISGVLRKKLGLNVICEKSSVSDEMIYRIVDTEVHA